MQLGNRLFKGAIPTIDHVASAEAWGARGMGRFHLSSSFPRALSAYFITLIFIMPTFFGACPVKIALWLVWVINPHLNIPFCVKISLLKALSSPVYTRANHESGTSRIRFAVYTQNVNPENFESGTSSGNIVSGYLRIRNPL